MNKNNATLLASVERRVHQFKTNLARDHLSPPVLSASEKAAYRKDLFETRTRAPDLATGDRQLVETLFLTTTKGGNEGLPDSLSGRLMCGAARAGATGGAGQ